MTPGFSLRRLVFRRRYFYARVALNPQQEKASWTAKQ